MLVLSAMLLSLQCVLLLPESVLFRLSVLIALGKP